MNKRAVIRMWAVIISFCIICAYLLFYDLIAYLNDDTNCNHDFSSEVGNDIYWFVSWSVSFYIWVLPIIFVFMPKFKCCFEDKEYSGIDKRALKLKIN